jgi:hypothetical protein
MEVQHYNFKGFFHRQTCLSIPVIFRRVRPFNRTKPACQSFRVNFLHTQYLSINPVPGIVIPVQLIKHPLAENLPESWEL